MKAAPSRRAGRGVPRQQRSSSMAEALRRDITRGRFKPGARFPTRDDLEKRFDASRATVQKALDTLMREGFVHAEGRRGTFVSERPPHLSEYALCFAKEPQTDVQWSRFYTAIRDESQAIAREGETRFKEYYGLAAGALADDAKRLADDALGGRLAGVVYTYPPFELEGAPVLTECDLPQIAIMDAPQITGVRSVYPSQKSFLSRAVEYLAQRGRTRIGLMTVTTFRSDLMAYFKETAHEHGLETADEWTQAVCLCRNAVPSARNLAKLMVTPRGDARPDALIIADDNFVEHASAGLVAAGVRVGEDVDVVAHCNFPWPPPSVLPVKRLGFDIRRLIADSVDVLRRARSGRKASQVTRIPAVFEDEYAAATADRTSQGGAL